MESLKLVKPQFIPALDDRFRPAVLANREFKKEVARVGVPLVIGLERNDGELSRFETIIFPEGHLRAEANFRYVERLVKFLLWQRGGYKVYIGGPRSIGNYILKCYAPNGERKFDYHFMGEQVYERTFTVIACDASEVPPARETGRRLASERHH